MKTTIALSLALILALPSAQAQIFRPESVGGVVLGGIAGAVIGHNSGSLNHNAWQGAAIGAGSGLILGSMIGEGRSRSTYAGTQVPVPDYPQAYAYQDTPVYYSPSSDPEYYTRPDYIATGTLLGGIAGAIIGNNSGSLNHNAWKGAAIGAGAGTLLGVIAENNARRREAAAAKTVTVAPATTTTTPQNVTIINNNYYGNTPATPMSQANSLFGR